MYYIVFGQQIFVQQNCFFHISNSPLTNFKFLKIAQVVVFKLLLYTVDRLTLRSGKSSVDKKHIKTPFLGYFVATGHTFNH